MGHVKWPLPSVSRSWVATISFSLLVVQMFSCKAEIFVMKNKSKAMIPNEFKQTNKYNFSTVGVSLSFLKGHFIPTDSGHRGRWDLWDDACPPHPLSRRMKRVRDPKQNRVGSFWVSSAFGNLRWPRNGDLGREKCQGTKKHLLGFWLEELVFRVRQRVPSKETVLTHVIRWYSWYHPGQKCSCPPYPQILYLQSQNLQNSFVIPRSILATLLGHLGTRTERWKTYIVQLVSSQLRLNKVTFWPLISALILCKCLFWNLSNAIFFTSVI